MCIACNLTEKLFVFVLFYDTLERPVKNFTLLTDKTTWTFQKSQLKITVQAQVTIAKPNVICTKTYVHKHATNY